MDIHWSWKSFKEMSGSEVYEVLSERQKVFIVEQKCLYHDADKLDRKSVHLIGRGSDQILLAYARIIPPQTKGGSPSIGRVLITQTGRGVGFGRQLFQQCVDKCILEYPTVTIQISAQIRLVDFYNSFGFITVGQPYDDQGIDHIDMQRLPE